MVHNIEMRKMWLELITLFQKKYFVKVFNSANPENNRVPVFIPTKYGEEKVTAHAKRMKLDEKAETQKAELEKRKCKRKEMSLTLRGGESESVQTNWWRV